MHTTISRLPSWLLRGGKFALVGATATAGSFAAAGFTDRFVGAALATTTLDVLPPIVFEYGILWLGSLARPLLVASMTMAAVVAFGAAAGIAERVTDSRPLALRGAAVFALLTALAALATGALASALGAGIAGTIAFVVPEIDATGNVSDVRRQLLRTTGVFAGTLGLGAVLASQRDTAVPSAGELGPGADLDDDRIPELLDLAGERSFDLPDSEPIISEDFYKVDINVASDPAIDPSDWSLRIYGDVDRERELDFDGLLARPTEHRFLTLRCVSDYVNGNLMDTALWTGTPLAPVLNAAGAGENCCVRLEADDGYYHAFPREVLETGFLAWGMNGEPLPQGHGSPVRVLIPGHWGEVNVKWLTDIEIRDEPATSYWEERGWQGGGPVHTVAKMRTHVRDGDRVTVGGHVYAGVRGVNRVEVSTDGGDTWEEAELSDPLPSATATGGTIDPDSQAHDAWRMWRHSYEKPERHDVVARAYEGDGTLQPDTETRPHPSGSMGWVSHPIGSSEQ